MPANLLCRQGRQEISNNAVSLFCIPALKFSSKVGTISRFENLDRSFCAIPFLRRCVPVLGARYLCSPYGQKNETAARTGRYPQPPWPYWLSVVTGKWPDETAAIQRV